MGVAKVTLNGSTLMDTTGKTVAADKMLASYTALDKAGNNVTGSIATKTSSNLTASGATVTAPAGYYASDASKSVSTMTLPTAASSTSSGTSKATIGRSTSAQYINIPTGYNSAASYYTISATANMTLPTAASSTSSGTSKATISRSTSAQYINIPTGYNGTASYYTISATPNMTLPTAASSTSSGTSKATIGRSTSNQYINIPTGYNETASYYTISAVANGTAGTPTATKGTVSNHQVSVTPSVTNTTGYITGSTKTGTAVTVTASELASGNKEITSNGTGIDVVGYSTVSVNVSPEYTATISGSGASNVVYVQLNSGTMYYTDGDTFTFHEGDSLYMQARGQRSSSSITINGTTVATGADQYHSATYTYTLPAANISIKLFYGSLGTINVTTVYPSTLTYESGTWTPASDSTTATISFSNSHEDAPFYYCIMEGASGFTATSGTNMCATFTSMYGLFEDGIYYGTNTVRYGELRKYYLNTNGTATNNASTPTTTTGLLAYATNTEFIVTADTNIYWRSGRTYKWIAVWAPGTS